MLVSLEEAERQLNQRFNNAEFDLSNFRLRGPGLSGADFAKIEKALECELPQSYREIASRINFGHLTLGSMQFGTGCLPQADELITQNTDGSWWTGERPKSFIQIGSGDPYVALLRINDGAIVAFERDWTCARVVASDLSLFVRGLVTAYILREDKTAMPSQADILNASVNGDSPVFWEQALG